MKSMQWWIKILKTATNASIASPTKKKNSTSSRILDSLTYTSKPSCNGKTISMFTSKHVGIRYTQVAMIRF